MDPPQNVNLSILPNEIIMLILEQLPVKELITLSAVSKYWNRYIFSRYSGCIVLNIEKEAFVNNVPDRKYRNICIDATIHPFPETELLQLHESLTELEIIARHMDASVVYRMLKTCRGLKRLECDTIILKIQDDPMAYRLAEPCSNVVDLAIGVAMQLAPKMFPSFHQLFGLNLASVNYLRITGEVHEIALVQLLGRQLKTLRVLSVKQENVPSFLALKLSSLVRLDVGIDLPAMRVIGNQSELFLDNLSMLKSARFKLTGYSPKTFIKVIFAALQQLEQLELCFQNASELQEYDMVWPTMKVMESLKTLTLNGEMEVEPFDTELPLARSKQYLRCINFVPLISCCPLLRAITISKYEFCDLTLNTICTSLPLLEVLSFYTGKLCEETVARLNQCPKLHTLNITIMEINVTTELASLERIILDSSMRILELYFLTEMNIGPMITVKPRNQSLQLTVCSKPSGY